MGTEISKGSNPKGVNNASFQSYLNLSPLSSNVYRLANLSPGYIQKLKQYPILPNFNIRERFELASDDFTLDKKALKDYFKCSERECAILFEHFDMDGNGKIDSYELICALAMLSHSTLDEKAELIFSLYDFDGSKYISREELVILMTNSLTAINNMQKKAPPSIQEIEAKTTEFFTKSDVDKDQKITLKEFKDYINKDKAVLEVLISANIAKKEDLGMDFGSGDQAVPDTDPDLENECNPKDLERNIKKTNIKQGIDSVQGMFEEEGVEEGDQFMAVKPWKGVVDHSVPTKYKPSSRDGAAPDATLQLEYIYGYRCHDARNNLRYTANGQIVYHAAGVGIVLDKEKNTQKFLMEHNDDIHCLAVDPTGKYAATGQIGPKPWLFVWDTATMECLARINAPLTKGIKTVAFSNDGKLLAATALDDDHNIAIFDWATKPKTGQAMKPVATGKGTKSNILSLGFNPQNSQVVATCVKEVNFFSFANGVIKAQKGTGWGSKPAETVLCQAYVDNTLVTGAFSGALHIWNGSAISKAVKAHTDGCHALNSRRSKKGIISGGGDGLIIIWGFSNTGLTQEKSLDLKLPELKSLIPKARSVCEHPTIAGQILVGTRGGEIMELGGSRASVLIRSHCDGELWGLAPHPKTQEFITIGQDNMLAIWDIKGRRQKKFARLDCGAIGYINGSVTLLDESFSVIAIRKDRAKPISEIKFSPDNSICAVGAHDSIILTYDVKNNMKPMKKIQGHHSTIAHFDFSQDGRSLMSNCTSYEILFFNIQTGKQNPSGASALKDEVWQSWTCTLGWPVQGIFPPCADGSDINACDRAPDGTVLATADDFGMVKLFKYPCPVEKASFNQYIGHSSHVTNVRFIPNSPHLISTGGEDKTIFQWKYLFDKESTKQSAQNHHAEVEVDDDDSGGFGFGDEGMMEEEGVAEGDQIGAIKPFKGEVDNSIPSNFKRTKGMGDAPNGNLKLKYAHGFRSFDTRSNLRYSSSGEVVFTTAALGVVLNKQSNTQKFFNSHEEDIVAMAIHPGKDIIATGQMAAKGKAKFIDIFLWKASTQEVLANFKGFHRRAIRILQFSPSGDKLLSVGDDDQHSVAVYSTVGTGGMICNAKVDPDKMYDACWKDENSFAIVGLKCVKFFEMQGQNFNGSKGIYGSIPVTAMFCCAFGFKNQTFLTGTPTGELVIWNGRTVSKAQKAHSDALWQIQNIQKGAMIMTGGNDAKVIFWDQGFAQKKVIDLAPMSKFQAGVRSLDYHEQSQNLLVGTRGSEIIEIDGKGQKLKTLIYGHFEGTKQAELWGCAVHPKEQLFASCGADMTIRVWKVNEMVSCSPPDEFQVDLTAMDWARNGAFMVVGDRKGYVYSVDAKTLKKLATFKCALADAKNVHGEPWIEDIKISPNSQMFAVGTHGGLSKLDLVKILDNGKKLNKIASINLGVSSAITHIDWSTDSNSIVINSQGYELMWIDASSQKRINASSAKDIDYQNWTCILGWQVQGIWPGSDYTDVNSTCRSTSRAVLATGDDFGKVKIFKYPCIEEHASSKEYMGHSSHVTKVKFSADDQYVVSTGGNDKTVLIWETDFPLGGTVAQEHLDQQNEEEEEEEVKGGRFQQNDDEDDFIPSKIDKSRQQKQQSKEEIKKQFNKSLGGKKAPKEQMDDFFEREDIEEGDQFGAVKPWIGQIKEPSDFRKPPKGQSDPPAIKLELEWVHGYRAKDSKNNISFLVDGSIAYNAAGLGVVYNPSEHNQRFFNKHTDDVTAIAFSPDKQTIATGEVGPKPVIYIWDAMSLLPSKTLKGKLTKGIECLAFSPSGKVLVAVAIDDDHSVAAYNSETGTCLGFCKGDKAKILEVSMKSDTEFATAGPKHFMVWTISGGNLSNKRGQFGKADPRIGSCRYSGQNCLTGCFTGELFVWSNASISKAIPLHDRPLDAIYTNEQYVMTGGRDGKVAVLNAANFGEVFSFNILDQAFSSVAPQIRALCLNETQNTLMIGTFGSEIYSVQIDLKKKGIGNPKVLIQGHYSPCNKDNNEVWGLAIFPNKEQYVSVSDDGTMRVWDSKARKQIKIVSLTLDDKGQQLPLDPVTNELSNAVKGRSVDVSSNGKYCAVGFRDGSYRLYDTASWKMLGPIQKPSKQLIGDLKFSPESNLLAVTSHDRNIYTVTIPKLQTKNKMCASRSGITHLDWSQDGAKLHTNDTSYEVLYYNVEQGKQDLGGVSSLRDEVWNTYTTPLGWHTQGIWPSGVDGTDINAVARSSGPSHDGYHLIASADDFSKVKVFRYPSMVDQSKAVEGTGHSSHVTNVSFSKDDKFLFSTGGNDTCVFQWKLE